MEQIKETTNNPYKVFVNKSGTGKTDSQTLNVLNLSLLKDNDHFFGGSKFHK